MAAGGGLIALAGCQLRRQSAAPAPGLATLKLGALLGIAATMITGLPCGGHSMISCPTAMLWGNRGDVGWRRASFVRAVAALRAVAACCGGRARSKGP